MSAVAVDAVRVDQDVDVDEDHSRPSIRSRRSALLLRLTPGRVPRPSNVMTSGVSLSAGCRSRRVSSALTASSITARAFGTEIGYTVGLFFNLPLPSNFGIFTEAIYSQKIITQEEAGGDSLSGIAVHIAARIMSCAGPSQLLVSRTVRELTSGSDIEFEDVGARSLKGVPGEWQLFSATNPR